MQVRKRSIYEPSAIAYHEHRQSIIQSHRALRVCKALKNLHTDDVIEFPDTLYN